MKGVLRGYENWNPVHPTLGAFWGMGLGVGCGIGWGPGFGPEVIGYVGSGCGVGFNVGFTLVGAGIGLPAHSLMGAPYNAFSATRNGVLEMGRLSERYGITAAASDGWTRLATCITNLQSEVRQGFSSFKNELYADEKIDAYDNGSRLYFPLVNHIKKLGSNFAGLRKVAPFPPNFKDVVKTIFKRLFGVYAHIYPSHFQKMEFDLIDKKELAPLQELIESIVSPF